MERCIECGEWFETDGEEHDGFCSKGCRMEFVQRERDAAAQAHRQETEP